MRYAVKMGSGVMIYIPTFIKMVQAFKVDRGDTQIDSMVVA
jgi:hypothetical protein